MTNEQLQVIRSRVQQAKDSADMSLAAVVMLERNLRELVQQLHQLHGILQAGHK